MHDAPEQLTASLLDELSRDADNRQFPNERSSRQRHANFAELNGGGGEIRTPGRFPVAGFQDRCLKPLGHPSAREI